LAFCAAVKGVLVIAISLPSTLVELAAPSLSPYGLIGTSE